jgi:hypothetical protein
VILDPSILACCDKCDLTEELAMLPTARGNWAPTNIAVALMARGWSIIGEAQYCHECAPATVGAA